MTTKVLQSPEMTLYDAQAPNPYVVRFFIHERGGTSLFPNLKFKNIDIMNLENRHPAYKAINSRGELPALALSDGTVITEITAICEYLDETALSGPSLYGSTPLERAETRMWLRRMDNEIAQPIISWWRNDPSTIDFYQGNRIPIPEARLIQKVLINQGLNRLDDELEGKKWLCGERFSAADVHFYGLVKMMTVSAEWVLLPGRKNVVAYFKRIDEREGSQAAFKQFV